MNLASLSFGSSFPHPAQVWFPRKVAVPLGTPPESYQLFVDLTAPVRNCWTLSYHRLAWIAAPEEVGRGRQLAPHSWLGRVLPPLCCFG